jgi:hypothetical protein
MVTFNPEEHPDRIRERARSKHLMLTKFFETNRSRDLGPIARWYTYQEFPQYFVWDGKKYEWHLHQSGTAIGRMYFVSPTAGERFYLCLLLSVVRGPISFEDLRSYHGHEYATFRDACIARGLLDDDGEWHTCLADAVDMQTGYQLRRLFATLLLFCSPTQPEVLWNEFREKICDDLRHQLRSRGLDDPTPDSIYDFGLYCLDQLLREAGRSLQEFSSMPRPTHAWESIGNPFFAAHMNFVPEEELTMAVAAIQRLNQEQSLAFSEIINSVHNADGSLFFLEGPGGTGKTFVYSTICHQLRGEGMIVLCVASSGITALLLRGGRTAHSTFKILVDSLNEDSMCNINKESPYAEFLRHVRLLIWDEAANQSRYAPEAVD